MSKNRGKGRRNDTGEHTDRDTIRNLKATIRRQEKEIGQLRRELTRTRKPEPTYTGHPPPKTPRVEKCSECGKGNLQVFDLGIKKLVTCDLPCGFRKVVK